MNVYGIVIFLILFLIIAPDIYIYKRFLTKGMKKSLRILHCIICAYFSLAMIYIMSNINQIQSPSINFHYMIFITGIGCIYFPKLIFCTFDLISMQFKSIKSQLRLTGALLGLISFCMIVYSVHWGKFNWGREEYIVEIEQLPDAFDGYRIVQISDLHLGSFNHAHKKVKPLFDMVNKENADIIVFTGDMVNNFHTETEGWEPLFASLKSKDTMVAIMGNHDYTPYFNWRSKEEETKNAELIKDKIRSLGFKLLLNQAHHVKRGKDSIAFVGVDYSSPKKEMPQHSDVLKAYREAVGTNTKIVLMHDPTYIDDSIAPLKDVQLTICGHTHSAQIGIDTPWLKFSPAHLRFKYCDGIYALGRGNNVIVSRGLGCAGIPARLGMSPRYSVITLKKKKI